ncbi:MAG: hypothetical protein N3E52_05715, partial [Candidatus Bathyarchaeota archaeon]|nr:hypothetical protein [Candidatus Bathyarchaeota archaeon]
ITEMLKEIQNETQRVADSMSIGVNETKEGTLMAEEARKAFKEIVQKTSYFGPIFLLTLFVIAQIGSSYVVASRSYFELTAPQTAPLILQGDLWTDNAEFWKANEGVAVRNNTADYINSSYATASIELTARNVSNVWMEIRFNGTVNCGASGFKNVSFRVKQLEPTSLKPAKVSIYLSSLSDSSFHYDLTNTFQASDVNVWVNITLPVDVDQAGWSASDAVANWENITGLKLEFTWANRTDVVLLIDQLFFKGDYELLLDLYGVSYFANVALTSIAPFLFEWLLLTGLIYVMIKGLNGNVIWRPLMIAVGFALVVIVIQAFILAIVYTALPNLYYPLELLAGAPAESEAARQALLNSISFVSSVGGIVQIIVYVWIIALVAFIIRAITGDEKIAEQTRKTSIDTSVGHVVAPFGWMKCLFVSGISLFLTVIILGFLLGI